MRTAAIVVALGHALAAPALAGAAKQHGHHGRWITDKRGRVVILHGYNMVNKRPPYKPSKTGFDEDDARFLASEGYNTVRVGVIYAAVEPKPGKYDDDYIADIARTVEILGREGIYSLIDFHQDLYNERFFGEGWPDWAVLGDARTLPNQPNFGFPLNYLLMPSLQRAFDHFWNNDPGPGGVGLQDRYAAAWRHVAKRFRGNRWVLGYDLMNEPWPGTLWALCANPVGCPLFDATMARFIDRTIAAIRDVDERSLIFYEPHVLFNNGADTTLRDTGDPRAGFSFHDYCLTQSATQSDPIRVCQVFDDLVFRNAEDHARRVGDTLLLTEFGATDDLDTMRQMADRADEFMVSWQEWHYCGCDDPTTSGPGDTQAIVLDPERPPKDDNLKHDKLDVLSRPYPHAVAGTPKEFGFDYDSGEFRLRYTTEAAGGERLGKRALTEVFLPRRHYPDGYSVEVQEAKVVSEPGARVLELRACRGAQEVRVRVTLGDDQVTGDSC